MASITLAPERPCDQCGQPFQPLPVQVRRGAGRFCTHRCYTDSLKRGKPEVARRCDRCNTPYTVTAMRLSRPPKYCTPECRSAAKASKLRTPRASVEVACEACGTLFHVPNSRKAVGKGRWCSSACSQPTRVMTPIEALHYYRVPTDGCWGWNGPKAGWYGAISRGKTSVRASRVAWEEKAGPIPRDLGVLHTCDNPPCTRNDDIGTYEVNGRTTLRIGHLFLGTNADNTADMVAKGRQATGDTAGARVKIASMKRGESHHNRRLDADLVTKIRTEWKGGITQRVLASSYGVSQAEIHKVVRRKTWAHVP